MTRFAALLLLAFTIAACGAAESADGVTAQQVDGIWVFSHAPTDHMDALHGGRVAIEGGCLLVDGAAVVFHETMLQDASELVGTVRNGDEVIVTVPGGGVSLAEGGSIDQFPRVVVDRCDVDTVWFGAPGALEIQTTG